MSQIQKIDVLMPGRSQYEVLHHFTRKLFEAFVRAGYVCRLLVGNDRILGPLKDPPDLTICFNGAPKDEQGNFLCDSIRVPHVSCLIDPPFHFFDLTASQWMILTCDDRFCTQMLHDLNFFKALFMPHAVERDLKTEVHQKRLYDVVMLASFIDYETRRKRWKKQFPQIYRAMDQACEVTLSDEKTSFMLILQELLHPYLSSKNGKNQFNEETRQKIFSEVELYIKGRDRVELIRSIQDAKVHVFGAGIDGFVWEECFKNSPSVIPHKAVSYLEALEIMKQSKLVLNSSIKNKEGAHERIFAGLACGAAVVTNENDYLKEQFKKNEGLIFYKSHKHQEVNAQINDFLAHEDNRQKAVEQGQKKVMQYHTWDQRVEQLMRGVSSLSALFP